MYLKIFCFISRIIFNTAVTERFHNYPWLVKKITKGERQVYAQIAGRGLKSGK